MTNMFHDLQFPEFTTCWTNKTDLLWSHRWIDRPKNISQKLFGTHLKKRTNIFRLLGWPFAFQMCAGPKNQKETWDTWCTGSALKSHKNSRLSWNLRNDIAELCWINTRLHKKFDQGLYKPTRWFLCIFVLAAVLVLYICMYIHILYCNYIILFIVNTLEFQDHSKNGGPGSVV